MILLHGKPVDLDIWSLDGFLERMRAGNLPDNFMLSEEVWNELVVRINVDPELAREILDNGILLMLGAVKDADVGAVIALAEACVRE